MSSTTTTTRVSPESRGQYKARAYAAASANSPLAPTMILRRDPGDDDVQIKILFCGICHTDLHLVRNEWSAVRTVYPCVPGHEIVGRVTKVGSGVTKFKPGDLAAVGCWLTQTVTVTSARPALSSSAPT